MSMKFSRVLAALTLLSLLATTVFAQSFRGSISGVVSDKDGAVIPNASVTLVNKSTGVKRSVTADKDGEYVVAELPAGEYDITAKSQGFAIASYKAQVVVGKTTAVDITLKVGAAQTDENMLVTASAPLVDNTSATLSTIVDEKLVAELPLNGRDFGKLVALSTGVTTEGSGVAGTEKGFGQFNINGNRDRSNNYVLDGTDNNDPFFNNSALNQVGISGAPASLLPIDAIEEFNLQSQFAAEYGRNSGSVVNTITKSGTNQLHGAAFEYLRNSALDARNYFNPAGAKKTEFQNNQFGASLGGPIAHDKTFFFGAYEGQRERVGSDFLLYVPTASEIAAAKALAVSETGRTSFNPALDKILNFFPASATGTVNGAAQDKNDLNSAIAKVDHRFSDSEQFTARYAYSGSQQVFPLGSLGGWGSGSRIGRFSQSSPTRVQVLSFSLLSSLSAALTNELRYGYSRYRTSFNASDANWDPASIGLNTGTGFGSLPEIDFEGAIENLGATAYSIPRARTSQTHQLLDNVSWQHGSHSFKFGGEVRRSQVYSFNNNLERGLLVFSPSGRTDASGATIDPVVDVLANFYEGNNYGANINSGDTQRTTYSNGFSLFAQDSWRATQALTVDYGVRWEYYGPLSEKHNLLSNWSDATGDLALVGSNGVDGAWRRQWRNVSPRLGLAWSANKNLTVRAGYGLYYDNVPQSLVIANYTNSAGLATNPIGAKPVVNWQFDSSAWSTGSGAIFASAGGPYSIFVTPRDFKTPYTQSWNLNLQQSFGRAVALEVGYVGSKGTHLLRLRDLNQPDVNGDRADARYNYIDQLAPISSSTYHALQTTLRVRGYRGLSGQLGYVYGKSLDDASDAIDFAATAALPQDSTNIHAEHGASNFDTRHRFTGAVNYQLPVFSNLPKRLAEGWELNLITGVQSGRPIPIDTSNDTSALPNANWNTRSNYHQRPNLVKGVNPILSNWSGSRGYLNPNAFSQPADGSFGDLGRNAIYGPGFWNVDVSISKTTKLTERIHLQLRAELFNVFNHPNFSLPNAVYGSSSFGQFSQTPDVAQGNPGLGGGGSRVFQAAARFSF